ncbi:alr0857 family protein [Merismopedia glauca]|uniref:Uncharacterized protein n=1 Tax=Merismopedia glauca CCAP 1448/3 TaxID=1296344 RepID=A0A2T1BXJ0_9CYAN|nr:alr0857 family protein [Merismopedia glauca]PSB00627.1 hypothetical protein C7B64_22525 [Merismopedia glauca CCAP 1448/3]
MLKLIYTETNFNLEYLPDSLEDWVSQRVVLALRVGNSVLIEPSTASFLVSADLPQLKTIERMIDRGLMQTIELAISETGFAEVSISGSWLGEDEEADAGIFVTSLGDGVEMLMFQLWEASINKSPSTVGE